VAVSGHLGSEQLTKGEMDMFGGLTKTSSRIAIAAAFGLTLAGYAMSTPAKAADLGGDCCADLEERVAELEATTVRKGNKKVSVTLSGWVVKTANWWTDEDVDGFFVGDKGYDLGSRFAITGSATIAPGWSAGYNLTMLATSDLFATAGTLAASNQFIEGGGTYFTGGFNPLYSYMYIKSDTYGTLNWGHLSPASDNPAVLADISGTVIESNFVFFEGSSFFLRPTGGGSGLGALSGLSYGSFLTCSGLGANIGADCFGAAMPAVRYDSPTFGGFRIETSYGTNSLTGPAANFGATTTDDNFWDIAAFYNDDWGNFKVSAAYAYTWQESSAFIPKNEVDLHQVGATIMHAPSGLGIYGTYSYEDGGLLPNTDMWGVKPFIKRTWNPLGATVLFGEYAEYNDMYGLLGSTDVCAAGAGPMLGSPLCASTANPVNVTGSEVQRWGLGAVQEIDAAAMHVFARWQHIDGPDVNFQDTVTGTNLNQGFDDWDLFQVGGIIFF